MMPSTVSVVELIWTTLAGVGLFVNSWLWRDAIKSRNYWESQAMNGATDVTTRLNERSGTVSTIVQLVFVIIGLTAMTFPPTPRADVDPEFIRYIPAIGFIAVEIALVINGILARRDRETLLEMEADRVRNDRLIATYSITTATSDEELAEYAGQEMTRRTVSRPDVPMLRYLTDIRDRLRRLEREAGR